MEGPVLRRFRDTDVQYKECKMSATMFRINYATSVPDSISINNSESPTGILSSLPVHETHLNEMKGRNKMYGI
jgi:hypothetical protein